MDSLKKTPFTPAPPVPGEVPLVPAAQGAVPVVVPEALK